MKVRTSSESLVDEPPAPNVTEMNSGETVSRALIEAWRSGSFSGVRGGYTSKETGKRETVLIPVLLKSGHDGGGFHGNLSLAVTRWGKPEPGESARLFRFPV
jgi:hypothetical protein